MTKDEVSFLLVLISKTWPALVFLFCAFFEVTKIPINPLSSLRDWIMKPLSDKFDDLSVRIDKVEKDVNTYKRHQMIEKIYEIRKQIINFSDSCKNHEKHTQKEFQDMFVLHQKYLDLCEEANVSNGVVTVEYDLILETYKKVREDNTFI